MLILNQDVIFLEVMEATKIVQRVVAMTCMLYLLWSLRFLFSGQSNKRKRIRDVELPYHCKRKRILWEPLVRILGDDEFVRHHRISRALFDKIHKKIERHIKTDAKYVRKSCCRGNVSHIDSRSRLSMLLKHLAGSKTQDIYHAHGVSRPSVVQAIATTMDAIIQEFPIKPFPFDDETTLQKLADGFRMKSTGGLFENVVGAFDGYLLQICKRCIGKTSGVPDPSKYYCRKGFYAVNCQVSCDSNRKVTSLSMLCPGAVPDTLAHKKGTMNRSLVEGKLPERFMFIGDNAYPESDQMLTPCTRAQMKHDIHGYMDNYNFYLSQLRINIECTFGMIVNKFPILQAALMTSKLSSACKTFMVCCILHNLCIDERLEMTDTQPRSFNAKERYTQRAVETSRVLVEDEDFEYVEGMDEVTTQELLDRSANVGVTDEIDLTGLSAKERMIAIIASKGYVRPKY